MEYTNEMSEEEEEVEVHVIGVINEKKFSVSKFMLTSCSDYFNSMFSICYKEGLENYGKIQNTEPETFERILKYLKNGSMEIIDTVTSAVCVFQCAHVYQIRGIKEICEPIIYSGIAIDNCFDIYKVASQLSIWKMAAPALTCATWNCETVFKLESFLDSSLLDVCKFMRRKELNISKEFIIWETICSWIKKKEKIRKSELLELLACIDYTNLKLSEIDDMIFNNYVMRDVKAKELLNLIKRVLEDRDTMSIDDAIYLYSNDCNDDGVKLVLKSTFCEPKRVERIHSGVPWFTVFEIIDDEKTKKRFSIPHILCYDCTSNRVTKILTPSDFTDKDNLCVGFRVCPIGYYLYFLGGQFLKDNSTWNEIRKFNTVTEKWEKETGVLPKHRRNHMICVVDSVIYLIGGYGEQRIDLHSMDAFDTKTRKWLDLFENVPFNGIGGCCVYNKSILIFVEDKMHVYYVEPRKWNSFNILTSEARTFDKAVCHNHFVYLFQYFSNEVFKANVLGYDEISTTNSSKEINVEYFCSFQNGTQNNTENVCVTDDCIFSFTVEDNLQNKPFKEFVNVIEVIPLTEESLKKYKAFANNAQLDLNEDMELDIVCASSMEEEPEYRRIERSKVNVEAYHFQHNPLDLKEDYLRRKRSNLRTRHSDDGGEASKLPAQQQEIQTSGASNVISSDQEQMQQQLPLNIQQMQVQDQAGGASHGMKDKSRRDNPYPRMPFVPEQGIKIWERKMDNSELPNITFITGSFYFGCSTLFKLDEDCVKKEIKSLVLPQKEK